MYTIKHADMVYAMKEELNMNFRMIVQFAFASDCKDKVTPDKRNLEQLKCKWYHTVCLRSLDLQDCVSWFREQCRSRMLSSSVVYVKHPNYDEVLNVYAFKIPHWYDRNLPNFYTIMSSTNEETVYKTALYFEKLPRHYNIPID